MANRSRADIRRKIHGRIRKKVNGTAECPRLAVFRSIKHIYAQVIDDVKSETLVAASTTEGDFKGKTSGNVEAAKAVGKMIAERAIKEGIENVVYDRGGYVYHGRVKALIDASREAGLNQNGSKGAKATSNEEQNADKKSSESKKEKKAKQEKKEKKPAKKKEDKKSKDKVEEKSADVREHTKAKEEEE